MGGIGALVATDLQVALGDGVLFTICASISACSFLAMVFLKYKQERWQKVRAELNLEKVS
jgi:hypothetical protein